MASYQKLNVLLARVQNAIGAGATGLGVTDFRTVDDNFNLDFTDAFTPINLAQGIFGQPAHVKGLGEVSTKVSFPLIVGYTGPNVHDFLTCSGMSYTGANGAAKYYAPSSSPETDWKDMTLWSYSGDKSTSNSLLTKAQSVMFDLKISGEVGKPCTFEFTGKGVPDGVPSAANYISDTLPLLSATIPAVIKTTSTQIGGRTFKFLKFSVTLANKVEIIKDSSQTFGYLRSTIVARDSKWDVTAYQEGLTGVNNNPVATMDAGTLTQLSIAWGTATNNATIQSSASKAQITGIKHGNDSGINTFDMSGVFVDNDWTFISTATT